MSKQGIQKGSPEENDSAFFVGESGIPDAGLDLVDELFVPKEKISYPDHDRWNNLGKTVRGIVAEESSKKKRIQVIIAFAAAACVVFFVGLGLLLKTPKEYPRVVNVQNTDAKSVLPLSATVEDDLADTEALMIQSELDLLLMELNEVGIIESGPDGVGDAIILDIMDSYDIDAAVIMDDYINAL